jgi:transcriptional regulator with XRE-family HTH domain
MVRRARDARGISQQRLAIRAGTTQTAISRLENGDVSPRVETLQRLLLAMGYRLDLSAMPMPGILDDRHHDEQLRLSVAERLAIAAGWNEFASELAYAVPPATAAAASVEHGTADRQDDKEPLVPSVPLSRPLEAFAALAAQDVDYVVIGGFAMQGHGHLRATVDVDLVLAPGAENLGRATAALTDLHARLGEVDGPRLGTDTQHFMALADDGNLTLTTTAGRLNVWVDTRQLDGARAWPEVRAAAETTIVGDDVPITIAGADDLIAMTRAAAKNRGSAASRLQDLGAIAALSRADNPAATEIVDRELRRRIEDRPAQLGPDRRIDPHR